MKQLKYISIISIMALITAPAVADIASAEYVDNVVGTMTQSAINTALAGKQDKLPNGPNDGKKYSLIWNGSGFAFEEFTTGGGGTSIDWVAISAYIANPAANPNYTYAGYGFAVDPENYGYANYCEGSAGYDADMEDQLYFGVDDGGSCSDSEFAGMTPGDWYYDLPSPINVKIEGRALCSSTEGTEYQPGDPDGSGSGDTKYCWCKITSPSASRWVLNHNYDDIHDAAELCADSCAASCLRGVRNNSDFRSALFGAIEQ